MKVFNFVQIALFLSTSLLVTALPQAERRPGPGRPPTRPTTSSSAPGRPTTTPKPPTPPTNGTDPHDQVDWSKHPFQKPGPNDSRGPCPGLNTLANHGFIQRSGKNLGLSEMIDAMKLAFNVSPDLTTIAAKVALLTSKNVDTIDALESIALHGNIEHDVSLSRKDAFAGNHIKFDEATYQDLATSNPGKDFYDPISAGKVQKIQLEKARKANPQLRNTIKEFLIRTRETVFYLSVFGDPITGIAPKKFVDVFFREERLPLAEGWKIPKNEMTPATDAKLKETVVKFSEWTPEPNQCNWITLAPGAPDDPVAKNQIFPGN